MAIRIGISGDEPPLDAGTGWLARVVPNEPLPSGLPCPVFFLPPGSRRPVENGCFVEDSTPPVVAGFEPGTEDLTFAVEVWAGASLTPLPDPPLPLVDDSPVAVQLSSVYWSVAESA